MIQFKYTLDKSSKKFVCPKCNKKSFVKYIETETNDYLSDEFGRCDRQSSCQYFLTPEKEQATFQILNIPKPETSYHSLELVEKTVSSTSSNNFIEFLKTLFSPDEVEKARQKYFIGTWSSWNGTTIFWQIDQLAKVHHGKVMMYEPNTGKRAKNKEGNGIFSTVRSLLKLDDFVLNQCLFGLHLANEYTSTIAIVESEKTAVIMSLFKPEYVWLATGSKGGFKYEFLKEIKNYKIVAFPDKSEFADWNNKAIELNRFGFKITVSDFLEKANYPNGTDLADVYINELKAKPPPEISITPLKGIEFSKESIKVCIIKEKPKASKAEITKEESYRAIQYFINNNTDTYTTVTNNT